MKDTRLNADTKATIAMFLALGGACGRLTLLRACDLLEDLNAHDAMDEKTRAIIERAIAGAHANLATEVA